jgi:hypothetical protein
MSTPNPTDPATNENNDENESDPLWRRLREADPAATLRSQPDSLSLLLRDSIDEAMPRRTRMAVVVGGLITLSALGVASPAIADGIHEFLAQTGWIGASPNPAGVDGRPVQTPTQPNTESDDSEWIEVGAPDFVTFSVTRFPGAITLPANYDPHAFATVVATQQQAGFPAGGVVQVTGIQANYETVARCAWIEEWLAADSGGDRTRRDAAAAVILKSATWPATVSSDGGGIVDFFTTLGHAAAAGDRQSVQREKDINCAPIPAGVTR